MCIEIPCLFCNDWRRLLFPEIYNVLCYEHVYVPAERRMKQCSRVHILVIVERIEKYLYTRCRHALLIMTETCNTANNNALPLTSSCSSLLVDGGRDWGGEVKFSV